MSGPEEPKAYFLTRAYSSLRTASTVSQEPQVWTGGTGTQSAAQMYSSAGWMHGTLKQLLTGEGVESRVVYERRFPTSLPQRKRESYFLTELDNVKRLIRRQGLLDADMNLRLKTTNSKDEAEVSGNTLEPYYKLKSQHDRTLVFESRFECGNLCLALKVDCSCPL